MPREKQHPRSGYAPNKDFPSIRKKPATRMVTDFLMVGLSDAYTNNYGKILKYKADYNARLLKKQEKSLQDQNSPLDASKNPTEKIVNKIHQKQKVLSDDEIEQIVKGYKSGLSMLELAAKFGCHKITISQKLKIAGVAIRRQSPDDSQIDKMVTLYQSGLSLATVGNKVGVSASTVLRYITKRGIVTRDEHGRAKSVYTLAY